MTPELRQGSIGDDARMSDFTIRPDVRTANYLSGDCPGCGRQRLELYVDGPEFDERAVGVQCEKCGRQWLLNPSTASFYHEFDESDPLHPTYAGDDNRPLGGP